jgi:hypothetical protein
LAAAIDSLKGEKGYEDFNVGGIIAVAPNTAYLSDYETLSGASNWLNIVISPNDTGINQSLLLGGRGRPNRGRLANNIGPGKKLPNANLFVTSQRGHGIQYYVPDMRRLGYCTTDSQ